MRDTVAGGPFPLTVYSHGSGGEPLPHYAAGGLAALSVPTMQMTARQDLVLADAEHAQPAWAGLDHPDDIWVEMPTGGHIPFITACDDPPICSASAACISWAKRPGARSSPASRCTPTSSSPRGSRGDSV